MIRLDRFISGRLLAVVVVFCIGGCQCEQKIREWVNESTRSSRQIDDEPDAETEDSVDDREPNDTREQAVDIELTDSLEPIQGTIAKPGDLDWYRLTTRSDKTWVLDFQIVPSGADAGTSLTPYALLTTQSAESDDDPYRYETRETSDGVSVARVEVGSDPVWLGVGGEADTTGRYEIDIQKRLSAAAVEREPNDRPDRPTAISYPGEVQGFFDREGDVDLYKIPTQNKAASVHRFQLSPTGVQPYRVQIYENDPDGAPFATFRVPTDDRLAIPNLELPVARSDVWFRVTPLTPESLENSSDDSPSNSDVETPDAGEKQLPDPTASYRIRLIRHPPAKSFVIESEPNDSSEGGFRVELGRPLRGYLHGADDRDVFRVAVGEPPERTDAGVGDAGEEPTDTDNTGTREPDTGGKPDVGADRAADPYAALPDKETPENLVQVGVKTLRENRPVRIDLLGHSADPSTYASAITDESGRATVCNVPIEEGFVEVAVSRPSDAKSTGLSRGYDYQLASVDMLSEIDDVEIEPNDRRARADRLRNRRTGFITGESDRDVYAFRVGGPPEEKPSSASETSENARPRGNADAGQSDTDEGATDSQTSAPRGLTEVSLELSVQQLDLKLELTDSTGAPIANIDRAGTASDERTRLDLPDGVYFLTVTSRRGGACKPYTLSIDTNKSATGSEGTR